MSIYIPIVPILWGMLAYAIVGLVMCPILVKWQTRFIHNFKGRSMWEGVTIPRAFIVSTLVWLPMLFITVKTEINYRRKGYL